MFKFYEVGGCVRDEIMGLKSKDIDFVAVASQELLDKTPGAADVFKSLVRHLQGQEYTIFLETADCFTVRAKFPKSHKNQGMTADFVLARKEVGYAPGSRKPQVVAGTLYDDLERRDFTINAIARAEDGTLIDPFKGQQDIAHYILRTPLPVEQTFNDDPLRILRAIRFAITKKMDIPTDMYHVIRGYDYYGKMPVVSTERIRDELFKMFKHNTMDTLRMLGVYSKLATYIFHTTDLWLKPTTEK